VIAVGTPVRSTDPDDSGVTGCVWEVNRVRDEAYVRWVDGTEVRFTWCPVTELEVCK
jgi:hypothetical protein